MLARKANRAAMYAGACSESEDVRREDRVLAVMEAKRQRRLEEASSAGSQAPALQQPAAAQESVASAAARDESNSDSNSSSSSSSEERRRREKRARKREKKEKREKEKKKKKKRKKKRSRDDDDDEQQRSVVTGKRIKHSAGSVADEDGEARRERLREQMNGGESEGAWNKKAPKTEAEELAERARFDPTLMKELMQKGHEAQREKEGRRGKAPATAARQKYLADILASQREQGLR